MKTLSVILLAAASSAQSAEDASTVGSIRASRTAARGETPVQYPVEKKKERRILDEKQLKIHNDVYDRHLMKKNARKSDVKTSDKATETGKRELTYKAKSGFSKLMYQDDNAWRAGGRTYGRDNDSPVWADDDDDDKWGGKPMLCTNL